MIDKMDKISESINKVLKAMRRHSVPAYCTLMMIAAHESMGGRYRYQVTKGGKKGKARGVFQMEKETHDSIWAHSDSIASLSALCGYNQDFERLEVDDDYAVFMARCYLLMDANPLPANLEDAAKYCKSYWNRNGKATSDKYLNDYYLYVGLR